MLTSKRSIAGFLALVVCIPCMLYGQESAVPPGPGAEGAPAAVAGSTSGTRYEVRFDGPGNRGLLALLKERSDALALRGDLPTSYAHLARRARRDVGRFRQVLRSEGYYGEEVGFEIDDAAKPWSLVYTVAPGPRFTFDALRIQWPGGEPDIDLAALREAAGIREGDPARAQRVLDAGAAMLAYLRRHGFPFPERVDREVVADHATETVLVTFSIAAGPSALFGEAVPEGLESVEEAVVHKRVSWEPGQPFSQRELDATRQRLFKTGLFSLVRLEPQRENTDAEGRVPVTVTLKERKHHTVKAGARYSTDEGVGIEGSWEDRNMRHMGETLEIEAILAQNERKLSANYIYPYFRREGQSLTLGLRFRDEDLDAYDAFGFSVSSLVSRTLSPTLDVSAGLRFRVSEVEQRRKTDSFHLLSAPLAARKRFGDAGMNPARGLRLRGRIEPFADPFGFRTTFLRADFEAVKYISFTEEEDWILACRFFAGTIMGAALGDIPAYERYYAGGGGSVRGYKYQSLTELDDSDDPLGGRSIIEAGLELRRKLAENLWLAGFVDGGWADESEFPGLDRMRYGAGLGVRYVTPVGPLRFDVAVPLNARDGVDDAVQLYVSVGQAF